jgi:hypothetical protein
MISTSLSYEVLIGTKNGKFVTLVGDCGGDVVGGDGLVSGIDADDDIVELSSTISSLVCRYKKIPGIR